MKNTQPLIFVAWPFTSPHPTLLHSLLPRLPDSSSFQVSLPNSSRPRYPVIEFSGFSKNPTWRPNAFSVLQSLVLDFVDQVREEFYFELYVVNKSTHPRKISQNKSYYDSLCDRLNRPSRVGFT